VPKSFMLSCSRFDRILDGDCQRVISLMVHVSKKSQEKTLTPTGLANVRIAKDASLSVSDMSNTHVLKKA